MKKILLAFLLVHCYLLVAQSEDSVPAKPVELTVQTYQNNSQLFLAISYQNFPEWHTYWKNPGDAGLSLKNIFSIGAKLIEIPEEQWPTPRRFIENGNQWAYGYVASYTLFYALDKSIINKITGKNIDLHATWLVCRHVCVPGEKKLTFKIANNKLLTSESDLLAPLSELELSSRYFNLPKFSTTPDYLQFKLARSSKDKTLVLTYDLKKNSDLNYLKNANLIYPLPSAPFNMGHENIIAKEDGLSGTVEVEWDGEYSTPPEDLPANGVFKKPHKLKFLFNDPVQRKPIIIEQTFKSFDLSAEESTIVDSSPPKTQAPPSTKTMNKISMSVSGESSLFYYLILAFLGGLILNVMPCVLPVISLKLFGLIQYQNESRSRIFQHNLFYTLGVLSTFLILALTIVSLKTLGTQVGWGFQLQSPNFVAIMILVLFVFALNLFGLFELATPGGKKLGNIQIKNNFGGDFLGGVLATILSTPCSAPFLGTALTFAFSSSTFTIISIFLMIGLGLASPFILTALAPSLIAILPKPGTWMNTVKKILGVTLLLTILWLFDVYNALVDGSSQLIKLATCLVFIFSAFGLYKKDRWFGIISLLVAIGFFINLSTSTVVASREEMTALIRDKQSKGLNWEPWSERLMNEYRDNQQVVFIDFTAKWCFTCKVNERIVLDTEAFKQLTNEYNLKLLIGDWTKRDEVIASFLKSQGMVGVPAYFIQKKDGSLINLGETITIDKIKKHL